MKIRHALFTVFLFLFVLSLGGCGGGGGGTTAAPTATTSQGVITGFGSVIVNGVEYSGTPSVMVDDSSSTESNLRIGMMVRIKGTIDSSGTTGTATAILAADSLEGPVTAAPDLANNTFAVLGQTVKVDAATIYENTTGLAALATNNIVEVSGYADATGVILASRVELKTAVPAADTPIEVKGTVAALDTGLSTFTIGALTVNYGAATLSDFPVGGIADGQFVEVKSTFGQLAGLTLAATRVELEPGLDASEGEHVEIEGYVTSVDAGANTFVINNTTISAGTMALPAVGTRMEVEGTFVNGILVISQSEIEYESHILLEGDATAVSSAGGTVTLLGKTVSINATTELKDSSVAAVHLFSLADIAVGDHLEVSGYLDTGGAIIATKIERKDASNQVVVQGPVSAFVPTTSMTILGITVDTSTTSVSNFKQLDGTSFPSAAAFYATLVVDTTIVKAKGTVFTGSTLTATEVELEGS